LHTSGLLHPRIGRAAEIWYPKYRADSGQVGAGKWDPAAGIWYPKPTTGSAMPQGCGEMVPTDSLTESYTASAEKWDPLAEKWAPICGALGAALRRNRHPICGEMGADTLYTFNLPLIPNKDR